MSTKRILEIFDVSGILKAELYFDLQTRAFILQDRQSLTIINKAINFARLVFWAPLHPDNDTPQAGRHRRWFVLDTIPSDGTEASDPGDPNQPSRVEISNAGQLVTISCRVRNLLAHYRNPPASANPTAADETSLKFRFELDYRYVDVNDGAPQETLFRKVLVLPAQRSTSSAQPCLELPNGSAPPLSLGDLQTRFKATWNEDPALTHTSLALKALGFQLGTTVNPTRTLTFAFEAPIETAAEVPAGTTAEVPAAVPAAVPRPDRILTLTSACKLNRAADIVIASANGNAAADYRFALPKGKKLSLLQRLATRIADINSDLAPLPGAWEVVVAGAPLNVLLDAWEQFIASRYYDALLTVQGGHPTSALPSLNHDAKDFKDKGKVTLTFAFWDHRQLQTRSTEPIARSDNEQQAPTLALSFGVQSFTSELVPESLDFSLPRLIDHDDQGLTFTAGSFRFAFEPDSAAARADFHTQLYLYDISKPDDISKPGQPQTVRVGALDIDFLLPKAAIDLPNDSPAAPLAADLPPASINVAVRGALPTVDLSFRGSLMPKLVVRVRPGGQDDLPGEEFEDLGQPLTRQQIATTVSTRRERPVLVEFPPALLRACNFGSIGAEKSQVLDITETSSAGRSQALQMKLLQPPNGTTIASAPVATSATSAPSDFQRVLLVIDRQPLLIARVDIPPWEPAEDGLEIGNWESSGLEGASWEMIGTTNGFNFWLPPQSMCEAMEKGKSSDGFDDVEANQPADFQFSPSAYYSLSLSFFQQRFTRVPWDLRFILGFVGQRSPGAQIQRMRFELLYGLTGHASQLSLRLVQMDSRLGAILPRLPTELAWAKGRLPKQSFIQQQDTAFKDRQTQWDEATQVYQSRLSILEMWDPGEVVSDEQDPPALVLNEGLQYRIRDQAKLRYPISTQIVPLTDARRTTPPHTLDGLAGGATYGFESTNVYDSLIKSLATDEAQLTNPAFSALGGWGDQRAVFQNGLTTIISHTAMGRVTGYSIERLGRICPTWHRAKHVIVYERTVAASLAFGAQQDAVEGRAVLRKVREYVQCLQPHRNYPDHPGATADANISLGFLRGCVFASPIIEVDSRWGGDVGEIGWQMPIWQEPDPHFTGKEDNLRRPPMPPGADPQSSANPRNIPGAYGDYQKVLWMLVPSTDPTVPKPDANNPLVAHLYQCLTDRLNQLNRPDLRAFLDAMPEPPPSVKYADYATFDELRDILFPLLNERLNDDPAALPSPGVAANPPADEAWLFSAARVQALRDANVVFSDYGESLLASRPTGAARVAMNRVLLEDVFLFLEPDTPSMPISTVRVYPRPTVYFNMVTALPAGTGLESGLISDPNKLRFFTLTKVRDAQNQLQDNTNRNTDEWQAISGLDFPDLPRPAPSDIPAGDASNLDRPMSPAAMFEPGYADFTFTLLRQGQPINLLDGRATNAVSTQIRNVTLLRSVPTDRATALTKDVTDALTSAAALPDLGLNALSAVLASLPENTAPNQKLEQATYDAITAQFNDLKSQWSSNLTITDRVLSSALRGPEDICKGLADTAKSAMQRAEDRFATAIEDALEKWQAVWDQQAGSLSLNLVVDLPATAANPTTAATPVERACYIEAGKAALVLLESEFQYAAMLLLPLATGLEGLESLLNSTRTAIASFEHQLQAEIDTLNQSLKRLDTDLHQVLTQLEADSANLLASSLLANCLITVRRIRTGLAATTAQIHAALTQFEAAALRPLEGTLGQLAAKLKVNIQQLRQALDEQLDNLVKAVDALLQLLEAGITTTLATWCADTNSALKAIGDAVDQLLLTLATALNGLRSTLQTGADTVTKTLDAVLQPIRVAEQEINILARLCLDLQHKVADEVTKAVLIKAQAVAAAGTVINDRGTVTDFVRDTLETNVHSELEAIKTTVFALVLTGLDTLSSNQALLGIITDEAQQLKRDAMLIQLATRLPSITPAAGVETVRREVEQAIHGLEGDLSLYVQRTREAVVTKYGTGEALFQKAAAALDLARALADAPDVVGLSFNRRQIACFFHDPRAVLHTPVVALANRIGDDLKALGIRFPTNALAEHFLPMGLDKFNISDLLPDFAGLKLDGLLPNLKLPSISNDKIHITHGLDKQSQTAWLKATVDVPFDNDSDLFAIGAVKVRLLHAHFYAESQISAAASGATTQKASGYIDGDWEVQVGGETLVTFVQTRITFDDQQGLNCNLSADKVRLASPLNFLSQLISKLNYDKNGVIVKVLQENGLPFGFDAGLALSLPPLQFGAFGMSGLALAANFCIIVRPSSQGIDFSLNVSLALASRQAPFVLTIFILGGGGWLESDTTYHPLSRSITSTTSISIMATARLAFALGPISGGIGVDVSLSAEFHTDSQAGGLLTVLFTIVIWGEVQALGFISVSLRVMLQAEYQSNGSLIGRGSITLKIKVFWCFTFEFSASFEYRIAGSGAAAAEGNNSHFLPLAHPVAPLEMLTAGNSFLPTNLPRGGAVLADDEVRRKQDFLTRGVLPTAPAYEQLRQAAIDYISMFDAA